MELVFFIAAQMVLCFGFVSKTALLTHWWFSSCWAVLAQHKDFLCFSYQEETGVLVLGNSLRGNIARTADSNWPKGYSLPYNIVISNETGERKRFFQSSHSSESGWASMCWCEVVSNYLCSTCFLLFPSLIKLSLSKLTSFSCFCPYDFLPHPTGRVWVTGWGLGWQWGWIPCTLAFLTILRNWYTCKLQTLTNVPLPEYLVQTSCHSQRASQLCAWGNVP